MVEKSNSGMIQSEIHLWKFILQFDPEFPNEFVLARARSDLHVEGNESRVEQKMTADAGNRTRAAWLTTPTIFQSAKRRQKFGHVGEKAEYMYL